MLPSPTRERCISFESYIKPQLYGIGDMISSVVYLLNPTSNHNSAREYDRHQEVVYLLNPTSNHNLARASILARLLYIF